MRTGRVMAVMGIGVASTFLIACAYAFNQWDDGNPIVGKRSDLVSPSGEWIATLEEVDNGLGFGQGMLYDEVHIRRPNETVSDHGERAESAVFYIGAPGTAGGPPRLTWRDSRHLIIDYDERWSQGYSPGKSIINFHGISIEYRSHRFGN